MLSDTQVIRRLLDNLTGCDIRARFKRLDSVLNPIQLLVRSLHLPDQDIIRLHRLLLFRIFERLAPSLRVAELALVIALR